MINESNVYFINLNHCLVVISAGQELCTNKAKSIMIMNKPNLNICYVKIYSNWFFIFQNV